MLTRPKVYPEDDGLRRKEKAPYPEETGLDLMVRKNSRNLFGRRDWTRTNDPHHVKVVL